MKFTSFYNGFFVEDAASAVEKFEKLGFTIKHRNAGDGFQMTIMELPKGDRLAIVQAPPEMGSNELVTMINVDNIEEAEEVFCGEFGCTKISEIIAFKTTKFLNVAHDNHVITIMEHIK